jgi:hypothetical protein
MSEESYIAEYLPDDGATDITKLPGLRTFLGETDPFYDYIKAVKTDMPPGANIIGILQTRWRLMWEQAGVGQMADLLLMNVEQRRINLGDKNTERKIQFANPIAYDIWYLYYAGNVLLKSMPSGYSPEEWIIAQINGLEAITEENYMYNFFHSVDPTDTLKPLLQPYEEENVSIYAPFTASGLRGFSSVWGMDTMTSVQSTVAETWRLAIKEARFETWEWKKRTAYWPAKEGKYDSTTHPPAPLCGPKERAAYEPYCGYIAFPVGQLGVMWKAGLVTNSEMESAGHSSVRPVSGETLVEQGGLLLPPFTMATSEVPGELLINKGWLVADDSCGEFPAEPFDGVDNPELHYWLRYWIKRDNTEIVPGEFAALVCKPWPLHAWFYQRSSPMIYAGNWIETEFYTSGIIKEVLEPWTSDDPMPSDGYYDPDEQVGSANGNHYRIWVKGEEMIVESSDWKEYEVGERVGLLKRTRVGNGSGHDYVYTSPAGAVGSDPGPGTNFDWQGLKYMKLKGKDTPDNAIYKREWIIIPVQFF